MRQPTKHLQSNMHDRVRSNTRYCSLYCAGTHVVGDQYNTRA